MLFTDPLFLFYFLPLALFLHFLSLLLGRGPGYPALSKLVVFVLTLVFYGSRAPWWLAPFLASIIFDFLWAFLLARTAQPRWRKFWLLCSIAQNIGLLGAFKYGGFFSDVLAHGSGGLFPGVPRVLMDGQAIALPAGISFYTFESLSFVIDVYRGEVVLPRKILDFFAFMGMFPRFIAGPITRYREIAPQFARFAGMDLEKGLLIFSGGLFLKCCFADSFAAFTPYAFRDAAPGLLAAWLGVFAYTFQIYFDFSGYSLMAIGLGWCLGFQFPENFAQPLLAASLRELWRRWHMTLSRWLRDYIYLPLGGSRGGSLRTLRNLLVTMLVGGMWHGASWNFLIWGVFNAGVLYLEHLYLQPGGAPGRLARLRTFVLFMAGLVFVKARTLDQSWAILGAMFLPSRRILAFNPGALWAKPFSLAFCALGVLYGFYLEPRMPKWRARSSGWPVWAGGLALLACALLTSLSSATIPFLYFKF